MRSFLNNFKLDWYLVLTIIPIALAGLLSMNSFDVDNEFFTKQIIWFSIGWTVFFIFSFIDFRFLRNGNFLTLLYFLAVIVLGSLFLAGSVFNGAQSWLSFGFLAVQPADFSKIVLILLLAKYFSKRHVAIENFKHIIVSGIYALILFLLIAAQPDFGSAMIIFFIWMGMILVSGVSKKHLLFLITTGIAVVFALWSFVFADYQKDRITTFFYPEKDLSGAGYNSNQAKIAVGSGQLLGKGLGYGTQSRLKFLPEHETDFIFSSFAEEWGFFGVILIFILFFILIYRIALNASLGESNFEILFGAGVAFYFIAHFFIHVGINIGVLPVTGITIPFMSYGGSHLLSEFMVLGMMMGMRRYNRTIHRAETKGEFLGI